MGRIKTSGGSNTKIYCFPNCVFVYVVREKNDVFGVPRWRPIQFCRMCVLTSKILTSSFKRKSLQQKLNDLFFLLVYHQG